MNVKKMTLALAGIVFGGITTFHAQTFNSGDKELDLSLVEINAEAKVDLLGFKSSLKLEFNLAPEKATVMLKTMEPADLYLAVLIAKITAKPVDLVSASYIKNKGKGWGVIAKEMGIKPGSKEFHALKENTKNKHGKMKGKGKGKNANPHTKSKAIENGTKQAPAKKSTESTKSPEKVKSNVSPGKMK